MESTQKEIRNQLLNRIAKQLADVKYPNGGYDMMEFTKFFIPMANVVVEYGAALFQEAYNLGVKDSDWSEHVDLPRQLIMHMRERGLLNNF